MNKITVESDEPVVVLPADNYEAILETIDVLSNPQLVKDIKSAQQDLKDDKTIDLDKLWAQLS